MYSFQTRGNMDTQEKISIICDNLKEMLLEKNKNYGDSCFQPINVFFKKEDFDSTDSIALRLDEKLLRLKNSTELRKNDCIDSIGYLILLCIAKDWVDFRDQID